MDEVGESEERGDQKCTLYSGTVHRLYNTCKGVYQMIPLLFGTRLQSSHVIDKHRATAIDLSAGIDRVSTSNHPATARTT